MPIITDYGMSVLWSFYYWVSIVLFTLTQIAMAVTQNWERFWHNWYMVGIFVAIQMIVGILQLAAASFYNDGGRTLKYLAFAPWYMLIYWMVNTFTVVVMFFPVALSIWKRRDGGTWKPPDRSDSLTDGGLA